MSPTAVATLAPDAVHQVTVVPHGGVHAGDGSGRARPTSHLRTGLGLLAFLTLGAVGWRRATS